MSLRDHVAQLPVCERGIPCPGSLSYREWPQESRPSVAWPMSVLCPSPAALTRCDSYACLCTAGVHPLQPHSKEANTVVQMLMSLEDQGLQEISLERNFHKVWVSGPQPWGPALLQAADVQCQQFHHHDPDGPGWEGHSVELWLGRKDSCELEGPLNPLPGLPGEFSHRVKDLQDRSIISLEGNVWYAKFLGEKKKSTRMIYLQVLFKWRVTKATPADYGLFPECWNLEKWLLYHIITIFCQYPTYDNEDLVRSSGKPWKRDLRSKVWNFRDLRDHLISLLTEQKKEQNFVKGYWLI